MDREPGPLLHKALGDVPGGGISFDLPFAGLVVRILDLPAGSEEFVNDNYGLFATPIVRQIAPDILVRCREARSGGLPPPQPGMPPVVLVTPEAGGRYRIRSHWQEGWLDPTGGYGEILFTSRVMVHARMSLENYLRIACQVILIRRQAFLLHAAGILDGARCYLMFGASGAGKSTATMLSAPRPALSDDLVAVDASPDVPIAHAVPFFGAFPPENRARGSYAVAAALRLRRAHENRIEPLSAARAVATLSASVPFLAELGIDPSALTDVLDRFRRRVPVCELHFDRDPSFWGVLHREFGEG